MRRLVLGVVLSSISLADLAHAADKPSHVKLALDVDLAFPHEEPSVDSGLGGMLRLGYELDAILITLTPELGVGYTGFGGVSSPAVYRGVAGARLSLGKIVQPGIFAHIGAGNLSASAVAGAPDISRTALTYDGGVSLDLTLLPVIDVGAHASYNSLVGSAPQSDFAWFAVGLHVAVTL